MSYLGATADLLQVARGALRERVMARLDGEGRYEAAMVANAMAIAVRELELGPAARAEEHELLARFYGTPEASLGELRQRLCRDLRAGVDRARARASPAAAATCPCETADQQPGLSFHARAMNAADGQPQKHACT